MPLRVALIGFGGYGQTHCKALQTMRSAGLASLHAIAEINQDAWAAQLQDQAERGLDGTTVAVYRNFAAALHGEEQLLSPVAESIKLTRAQNGAYLSSRAVHRLSSDNYRRYEDNNVMATVCYGIDQLFYKCVALGKLPADCEKPWAMTVETLDVSGLQCFLPASPDSLGMSSKTRTALPSNPASSATANRRRQI